MTNQQDVPHMNQCEASPTMAKQAAPEDQATRDYIDVIRNSVQQNIRPLVITRLPEELSRQRVRLAALKWMKYAGLTDKAHNNRLFKFTLTVGELYTRCGNQSIALTKLLMRLDNISTHGNQDLRCQRKTCVVLVQDMLSQADALVEAAKHLKSVSKDVLRASPPPSPAQLHDEQHEDEMDIEEQHEETVEEDEEEEEEEGEEEQEQEDEDKHSTLPQWAPEYRLAAHRGVPNSALQVRLPNVLMTDIEVNIADESSGSDGVLIVSGTKRPTTRQWYHYQHYCALGRNVRAPFGKFEVKVDLGRGVVNTSGIGCSMEPGTGILTVLLPKKNRFPTRRHPQLHRQRPMSQQAPHGHHSPYPQPGAFSPFSKIFDTHVHAPQAHGFAF